MSDEIPDQQTEAQSVLQIRILPFHAERFGSLKTTPLFFLTYQLHRWQWNELGVCPFLTDNDRHRVACTCCGAYTEHIERRTDDSFNLSPLAVNGEVGRHLA